ncbi:monooxygenase [Elasticomyces elasticus]|nr:hypothetical protein LTR28_006002 [Elasticomyces elasticus]KAK4995884.1 monooxygenase [Elasticomyces elasticus]
MVSLPEPRRNVSSIAIIGAGPSGLAAAKYLLAEQCFTNVTIFEQRATVGGTWNYVPISPSELTSKELAVPQTDPHAGHDVPLRRSSGAGSGLLGEQEQSGDAVFLSPLYERLETNIPRNLMGFSDLNWPDECQLFPTHEEAMAYIERYAKDVRHLIRFRTQVLDVRLVEGQGGKDQWVVRTKSVAADDYGNDEEQVYDAVVVASGHFNVPYVPNINGIKAWNEKYPGVILHSKFYRRPEEYKGKKVVVVGNSASGIDIGAQISTVCARPLLQSARSESFLLSDASSSVRDMPEIIEFILPAAGNSPTRAVRFADGTIEENVDAIVFCTGYFYSYPFLQSLDPPLVSDGTRTENLYQHLFYRPHPTLAFPTLPQKIIPFPIAEAQSAVVARVWSGRLSLPSESDMRAWERRTLSENGPGRGFHLLKFPKDADYIDGLHDWAMSAELGEGGVRGKEPPYWGEKEYWMRERFPAIKKAFQDLGEGRRGTRRLEEIGFDFEAWKREREEEGKRLL